MENNKKQNSKAEESGIENNTAFADKAVNKGNSVNIQSPMDFAKKHWEESLEGFKDDLSNLNYMEYFEYMLGDDYNVPDKNAFLVAKFGIIFSVKLETRQKKDSNEEYFVLSFRKISNFIIKEASTVKRIYNNKCGNKNQYLYVLTLENNKGYIKSNIEIEGNAKSNYQDFQETLNQVDNNFQILCTHKEFKTLFEEYIQPKLDEKVILIYENPGKIEPNTFLGGDFLIKDGNIYYANEDGLIPTSQENVYVKANDKRAFKLPKLSKSDKSAQIIAKDFIQNIIEAWGTNYIQALLVIGQMISGLYFDRFASTTIGAPILILSGISGCGKSTLIQNGISIFGLSDDFLIAGNSTVLGQNFIAGSINNVNISVDDLSDRVLTSESFGESIKRLFKAIPRVRKINYGKDIYLEYSCSQIVYSTNSSLPETPELVNRANLITIMNNSLDTDKYHYLSEHRQNTEELSLLLPELLKFDEDYVMTKHEELKNEIKSNLQCNVMERIPHNIAYMWLGLSLLSKIAGIELENIEKDIFKYANEVVEYYKTLPTPVDMLINDLLTLKNHNVITDGQHYKIRQSYDKVHLLFHIDTLLQAHNRFFLDDKRKIKENIFKNYLKRDVRVKKNNLTVNYNGVRKSSIVLDITDSQDVWEFSGYPEPIKPDKPKDDNVLSEISNLFKDNGKDIT